MTHDEISRAKQQADQSQADLNHSLDDLNSVLDKTSEKVEGKLHRVTEKLEVGIKTVDQFIDTEKNRLEETLSDTDRKVAEMTEGFGAKIEQVQQIAGRVKDGVNDMIGQVDQVASKIEGLIGSVKGDVAQASDSVFSHAEKITQTFRNDLSDGAARVTELMDRAEDALKAVRDPVEFVRKNPNLGITTFLIGGIMIGMFFQSFFKHGRSRTQASPQLKQVA